MMVPACTGATTMMISRMATRMIVVRVLSKILPTIISTGLQYAQCFVIAHGSTCSAHNNINSPGMPWSFLPRTSDTSGTTRSSSSSSCCCNRSCICCCCNSCRFSCGRSSSIRIRSRRGNQKQQQQKNVSVRRPDNSAVSSCLAPQFRDGGVPARESLLLLLCWPFLPYHILINYASVIHGYKCCQDVETASAGLGLTAEAAMNCPL